MEVSIYINAYHKGHLSRGRGFYGIVLEHILKNGEPYTKEIFYSVQPTTKNQTALLACNKALEELQKPCDIKFYINNRYITETINQGWYLNWDTALWINKGKAISNVEQWQQLLRHMEVHKITFHYVEETEYSSYIKTMLKRMEE